MSIAPSATFSAVSEARRPRVPGHVLAIALGLLAALAYAVWLVSPRFRIPGPSDIDDWLAASRPSTSAGDLLDTFFTAPAQRFRPSWELYDYAVWHTAGAPLDMTGPNVWNALRVALLVVGVGAVASLLARTLRPSLHPATLGLIAFLTPSLVLSNGPTAVDVARLGPQEPIMVGASLCGAALVLLGLDRLVARRGRWSVLLPALAGWPLFVLGVFHKEASVALLVCVPFVAVFLLRRWRERAWIARWRQPLRDPRVWAFVAALALPLLWMSVQVAAARRSGADLYGRGAPSGLGAWVDRLRAAFDSQWDALTSAIGTPVWRAVALAIPFLAIAVWADRRRVPWLALGLSLAACAMFVLQGLPGVVTSRYVLPSMALFAIAAVLLLAESRAWLRWAALAAAAILLATSARPAYDAVEALAARDTATSRFAGDLARLAERGCIVHAYNTDMERFAAMPRLVAFQTERVGDGCDERSGAFLVALGGTEPQPGVRPFRPWDVCRTRWRQLIKRELWVLWRCDRTRTRVGKESVADILDGVRMVPGVDPGARAGCRATRPGDPSCDRPRLDRDARWP